MWGTTGLAMYSRVESAKHTTSFAMKALGHGTRAVHLGLRMLWAAIMRRREVICLKLSHGLIVFLSQICILFPVSIIFLSL